MIVTGRPPATGQLTLLWRVLTTSELLPGQLSFFFSPPSPRRITLYATAKGGCLAKKPVLRGQSATAKSNSSLLIRCPYLCALSSSYCLPIWSILNSASLQSDRQSDRKDKCSNTQCLTTIGETIACVNCKGLTTRRCDAGAIGVSVHSPAAHLATYLSNGKFARLDDDPYWVHMNTNVGNRSCWRTIESCNWRSKWSSQENSSTVMQRYN